MDQNPRLKSRQEFRVGIEGIELPPETVDRITRAIQKAVLTELAGTDIAVGFQAHFNHNGGTQGMQITAKW